MLQLVQSPSERLQRLIEERCGGTKAGDVGSAESLASEHGPALVSSYSRSSTAGDGQESRLVEKRGGSVLAASFSSSDPDNNRVEAEDDRDYV